MEITVSGPFLDDVAAAIIGAFPKLSPGEQRISFVLYRLLAKGAPVTAQDIAGESGLEPSRISDALRSWHGVYYDRRGAVIGYWGLTLARTKHRLRVNGRSLHAWCAWDTLFIPPILEADANIESACPVSEERISMTVTPRGVADVRPASTMLSFVTPEQAKVEENVILHFCHYVHFFASPEHGARWVAEHPGTFLLTLEEAWELGRRKNAVQYPEVLGRHAGAGRHAEPKTDGER